MIIYQRDMARVFSGDHKCICIFFFTDIALFLYRLSYQSILNCQYIFLLQNDRCFADDMFKSIFMNENIVFVFEFH